MTEAQVAVENVGDVRLLVYPETGPVLPGESGALQVLGEAFGAKADWVAVPADRLGPDFFRLRTGIAGRVAQKFAQYRVGLAVVGDITAHVAASTALRDLVRECERGSTFWFVPHLDELRARLEGTAS